MVLIHKLKKNALSRVSIKDIMIHYKLSYDAKAVSENYFENAEHREMCGRTMLLIYCLDKRLCASAEDQLERSVFQPWLNLNNKNNSQGKIPCQKRNVFR